MLVLMALLPVFPGAAAVRVGELAVRTGNNAVPCFTVSEREEQRSGAPQFRSITVSEPGAHAPMWAMALPKGRSFALANYMCVPYGGRPPVLPQTPSSKLQPGKSYEVVVNALPGRPGAPRLYRARFCVAAPGDAAGVTLLDARRAGCAR
jgi:hypothetical protein